MPQLCTRILHPMRPLLFRQSPACERDPLRWSDAARVSLTLEAQPGSVGRLVVLP